MPKLFDCARALWSGASKPPTNFGAVALVCALVCACQLDRPGVEAPPPPPPVVVDAAPPPPDALECDDWKATHFNPCEIPMPTGDLVLDQAGTYQYDTTNGELLDPDGMPVEHVAGELDQGDGLKTRVLVAERVVIADSAVLRASGELPLIVASWATIEISGGIDVSSTVASGAGAGADPGLCDRHRAGRGENENGGGAGGGGAGFGGSGGKGGNGDDDDILGDSQGGAGGERVPTPAVVRGGCDGGRGGNGNNGGGGASGLGGGAVQLTAALEIAVAGVIHAGGGGGQPGNPGSDAGGAGGGSGGYIGVEAPAIQLDVGTVLTANGGGGGAGSTNDGGTNPPTAAGDDGYTSTARAAGGNRGCCGSVDGAAGSGAEVLDGDSVGRTPDGGGGGAGGGAGYILIFTSNLVTDPVALTSPPPTLQ